MVQLTRLPHPVPDHCFESDLALRDEARASFSLLYPYRGLRHQ
jgi:hypothetical protein